MGNLQWEDTGSQKEYISFSEREKEMAQIYIGLVDTPGIFAYFIRRFLKQKYIHVVISMDAKMEDAYSIGRRNPFVPFFAGFEKEDKKKILRAFPTADYMVFTIECEKEQKENIRQTLYEDMAKRRSYHYAVLGLIFILCNRPFYQKNHYTCSSYIAKLLKDNGIIISEKHFSLVTPKDFYEYQYKNIVFEGPLSEMKERDSIWNLKCPEVAYEY